MAPHVPTTSLPLSLKTIIRSVLIYSTYRVEKRGACPAAEFLPWLCDNANVTRLLGHSCYKLRKRKKNQQ